MAAVAAHARFTEGCLLDSSNMCGVAVLSCTDCSGSSTSSDITDPGSPFSIASSHSEDSASQSAKMPPTQSAHHPPWSWTEENNPPLKRPTTTQDKAVFTKRLKTDGEETKQSPTCLIIDNVNNKSTQITATSTPNNNLHLNNNNNNNNNRKSVIIAQTPIVNAVNDRSNRNQPSPNHNNNNNNTLNGKLSGKNSSNKTIITSSTQVKKQEIVIAPRIMQQGKITEYFKSQLKSNGIKKELSNIALKTNPLEKFASIVDKHQKVVRKIESARSMNSINAKKIAGSPVKSRKQSPISVPRKILPAPSKIPEKITVNNVGINNFHPVTLTAVTFPPNLTYIHTKTPKPPDNTNIFVPHFTTITGDKINTIPIVNRTPCLNVIQPIQKFTTINNFNSCVKLNATVVPIVKLNALPSRLNGSNFNVLSVETASPTVLSAKPPVTLTTPTATSIAPKQQVNNVTNASPPAANNATSNSININTNGNSSSSTNTDSILGICRSDEPATPDSDSGISSTKDLLEVSVSEPVTDEPQKSPILSQPKTIRFPAKQQESSETKEKGSHSSDSTACQWSKCHLLFDTSGALLEHLQVEHVISQATQEQYVCLWLGCKVHGRTSCSRSWLERHVLAHAGTKPFRCIVDGCGMRFNSQLSLERHVNNHFNTDSTQNGNNKKAVENGSAKLFKRNGKKIRFRRQPWSARMFDFIDSGIMEGLQYRLLTMTEKRTSGEFENVAGDAVTVHSQILARRIEPDGSKKLLLRWHPKDILPDEWIPEKEYTAKKNVSIPKLMASAKDALNPVLFPNDGMRTRQKHRRKPSKTT